VELRQSTAVELIAALTSYDVIWFRLAHRIDAAALSQAKRCKVIATPVTGLDHVDLEACTRAGIRVVSLRGEVEFLREVRATAELTVALALALMRHISPAANSVREGRWNRDLFRGRELFGKTAGLVGVGRLGSIVGSYLQAFGMRVVGWDKRADFPDSIEQVQGLPELLGQADLISVHLSLDASTTGLLGHHALVMAKSGAWLINTARGGIVDEPALLEALDSGHLAGAALDVLCGEPGIDANNPMVRYAQTHDNPPSSSRIWGEIPKSHSRRPRCSWPRKCSRRLR